MRTIEGIERDVRPDGMVALDVYELRHLIAIARAARWHCAKASACVNGPSLINAVKEG